MAFSTRDAVAAGVEVGRLRRRDLHAPFWGVRSRVDAIPLVARCRALQTRMPPHAHFSHTTSALLWGMPLPLTLESDPVLHTTVVTPHRATLRSGVRSHQLAVGSSSIMRLGDLRLASPATTWCQLGTLLSVIDLVAAGDFLVTGERPLCTLEELIATARRYATRRGATALRAALPLIRIGPLSRPESHARVVFVTAGLPEPELNTDLVDDLGRFLAMSDLVWRSHRVAYE